MPEDFKQFYLEPEPLESNIGESGADTFLKRGAFKSPNYAKDKAGWSIDSEGNAEFQGGKFRGNFDIGGSVITVDSIDEVQETVDLVDTEGGGTVYLANGTYVLTADISIPSGVNLQGVSRDGVILDCNNAYSVTIKGTNVYSTGTLAISDTQDEVVGTGTTFTSAMVGRYIWLSGTWYEIAAFTDTTHIDISPAYSGDNLSSYAVSIADVNFNSAVSKVTIINSDAGGVECSHASETIIDDLVLYDNVTGLDLDYVLFPKILVASSENGVNLNMNFVTGFKIDFCEFNDSVTSHGIIMTDTDNATLFDSSIAGNTGDGLNLTNCKNIAIISFDISSNGGQGVEMVSGCNDNQIIAGRVVGNTSDGIKVTATSDRNIISSCSIKDSGGYGINIAASTCDNNTIIAPAFENNTSGDVNDSGTGTVRIQETDTSSFPTNIFYGDGSDGNVTISSNTTLTRDMYYNNLTIATTFTLDTANFDVYVMGTLTQQGTGKLINNGGAGGAGGNGSQSGGEGGSGGSAGSAGAAVAAGTSPAGKAGVVGQAGVTQSSNNAGDAGVNGTNGSAVTNSLGITGKTAAASGAGGNGSQGSGGTAGTNGTGGAVTASKASLRDPITASTMGVFVAGTMTTFTNNGQNGGTGSGAGGGGNSAAGRFGGSGGGSGGGGAEAGFMAVFANTIVTVGANTFFQAKGGAGGNGGNGGNSVAGNTGGGGAGAGGSGGNGGIIVIVYKTLTGTMNTDVTAGAGGTGGTGGNGAGTGTGGSNGSNGTAGATGTVFTIQL